jgi:hypothetical protein
LKRIKIEELEGVVGNPSLKSKKTKCPRIRFKVGGILLSKCKKNRASATTQDKGRGKPLAFKGSELNSSAKKGRKIAKFTN